MPPVRKDEFQEYPFAGPFPGLQSEVAPSQIGNAGFAELQNLMFRNSTASLVPEFTPLEGGSPDNSAIMGMFDFFPVNARRVSGVFTLNGNMFAYFHGAWVQVTPGTAPVPNNLGTTPFGTNLGPGIGPFTGTRSGYFQTAVVGYKMYFSQGVDPIQVWDGLMADAGVPTPHYFTADEWPIPSPQGFQYTHVCPVPARYLMELDFHLLVGNTRELPPTATPPSGNASCSNTSASYTQPAPQRVHWSASGDGSDWSSFSAGQEDLFNNLGPITGMTRLFQSGYIFQQWGVTQAVPTGNALAPFNFITMGAYAKGNTFPHALASFGELIAAYVGKDDIYIFDGTSSQPIGQHPIDGNRRLGARTRIFADLNASYAQFLADPSLVWTDSNVWGVIMTNANGNTYEAYWLFIPFLNKAWLYNFDESNWSQLFFQPGRLNGPAQPQFWAPQQQGNTQNFIPVDAMMIADNRANSVSYLDFTLPGKLPTVNSISPGDGWYIRSGPLDFDDNRHPHSVNKVRIVLTDVGTMQFYIRLHNEAGYFSPTQLVTLGEGTGGAITVMVNWPDATTGKYITWEMSGPPGVPFQLVEITPYPVLGGEVMTRCEVVVSPPTLPPSGDIAVSIIPGSASLAPGETQQFNATVSNSPNQSVHWTASDGTIDSTGLFTAPNVTAAEVVTIIATSSADSTKSAAVFVSIHPSTKVTVTITPSTVSVQSGHTQQFSHNVLNAVNQTVAWSATKGTITSSGLFTAPTVTQATTVTITAVSAADPTAIGQATVTVDVTVPPPPPGTISVTVTPTSATITSAGTQQFAHSVAGSTNQTVTWATTGGTISTAGLFTAPTVSSVTTYTITATAAADPTKHATATVTVNPVVTGQEDLLHWCVLSSRATQHLVGDPKAPYEVQWLDTDSGYPSNYPKNTLWFIKNKLGNPWDVLKYDSSHISHWMTENGDSADQAACQAANGTTCWLYARAYKRDLTPIPLLPRYFTPHTTITLDTAAANTTINRTTNCESTVTVVHLGPVHCITTGPFKISWGGSIDHGSGTLASGPNYDNTNGVDTIRSQYYYSQDSSQPSGYAALEDTYYVKGFGRVAWYYYVKGVFQQKTVNTTLASGGHPAPNFPCGPGKSWFV